MKLLLNPSGATKRTIADALCDMVGKTAGEVKIGFMPTVANVEMSAKE